jgi:NADH-quinone oxidoreductase subunit N
MQLTAGFSQLFENTGFLLPELILLLGAIALLVLGFFSSIPRAVLTSVAISTLLGSCLVLLMQWPESPYEFFYGALRVDPLANVLRLVLASTALLLIFMPLPNQRHFSEYLFFVLSITLGAQILVMSIDLLTVLLALELISLSSYALVGFSFSKKSAEGSWKYFLIGSVATAIMVFGMSYMFGATGTTLFTSRVFLNQVAQTPSTLFMFGALLALAGFLFKMAAAPFHWWAPDAYQSAPIAVTALVATLPKVAAVGVLIRFSFALQEAGLSYVNWRLIIAAIALITILVGTLGGLLQKDARRLMAYSSIAQSGFVLVGLASLSLVGVQAALFYLIALVVMNLLTFRCLHELAEVTGTFDLEQWAGWGRQQLLLTTLLTVGLIALAGLPPTGGFMAKLFVFTTLWGAYQTTGEYLLAALVAVGLITSVAGLFFYLKAPYFLLMKASSSAFETKKSKTGTLLTWLLVVVILFLFFQPGLLMGWLNRVTFVR